jgi:hypothetical protein
MGDDDADRPRVNTPPGPRHFGAPAPPLELMGRLSTGLPSDARRGLSGVVVAVERSGLPDESGASSLCSDDSGEGVPPDQEELHGGRRSMGCRHEPPAMARFGSSSGCVGAGDSHVCLSPSPMGVLL